MERVRLLHLPNERGDNIAVGARGAFSRLLAKGELEAYETVSFWKELKLAGTISGLQKKMVDTISIFKPNVILWQNIDNFPITPNFLDKVLSAIPNPKLVYVEQDVHGRIIGRISKQLSYILKAADLVFLVGLGNEADLIHRAGAKNIFYTPHSFDIERFGAEWEPTRERMFDVVMMGREGRTRIPGLYCPGGRKRARLCRLLNEKFGHKFAIYGQGWNKVSSWHGVLPFNEQTEACRSAWVTVNWHHFDSLPFYFSDRLPISLAAAIPHVTNYQPGYEYIFRDCKGLFMATTVNDVINITDYVLSLPIDTRIELGLKARDFAFRFLEATVVYGNILRRIKESFQKL